VNTTGELKFFYEHATVVFVGKSITANGGQNPIEPCALGKATVFGPNMQNFTDVVNQFLAKDAVVQVKDAAALETAFARLLHDSGQREELGRRASAVVQQNIGAIDRTVEMILQGVNDSGIYIAPKR
jgi:3-deoxy-D-manno-octulosonic-acid transferase